MNWLKKKIWRINYKIYSPLRETILFLGLWKHSGRQEFHIGYIKNNLDLKFIINFLKNKGFEPSICSWKDDGEVLSLRKCKDKYQYHLRLFSNGEIRGHYEYSPEGNPMGHLLGRCFEPWEKYFREILQEIL